MHFCSRLAAVITISVISIAASAQESNSKPLDSRFGNALVDSRNPKVFLKHLAEDQARIWTSPFRLKPGDAEWAVPFAGITTGLIMTDRTTAFQMSRVNRVNLSDNFANLGLATYGGAVAGFYFLGRYKNDPRKEETGLLAGEAGIDALAVGTVLKYAFERNRPLESDGKGHFFRPVSGSFYSAHSTIAWSFASVFASEYPGWATQALAYGAASAISVSRITGEKHWPSDTFVGAVTGYLIGREVYKTRHDPEIDSRLYGEFVHTRPLWNSDNAGTTYVPLDNWIYPVLQRLMAYGLIRYGYSGMRPYTRMSVANMIEEAEYRLADAKVSASIALDVDRLKDEFAPELNLANGLDNRRLMVESLYSRATYIAGRPLNDSYHFGQTIINDFGRPYESGFNEITGFSARAESGRFGFFVDGEYQHAPGAGPYSLAARQVISQADLIPLPSANPIPSVDRFKLLDTYASMTLFGHNIAVGKQSLWWGPDKGDAMIFSDNAEPIYMLQINRTIPLKIPLLSKLTGPFRYDFFFGKLTGHQFPPNPYMHGEKVSFKPTENLEFGFSRTAIFAGQGLTPLTLGTFWSSFSSTSTSGGTAGNFRNSPGVRHGQFDFSYRVPGLRNWLTIYSDSLVHDDISPIDAPRRAAINPGFYLSHFPGVSKLDLRVEAVNTDPPISNSISGSFIYWEVVYHDLYLNKSSLMGSWIGREGKGFQAWSTYWVSPQTKIQFQYRNAKVAKDFIPEGETQNSYALQTTFRFSPEWEFQSTFQYERWKAPVLAAGLESDFTSSIGLTYWPKHWRITSSPDH